MSIFFCRITDFFYSLFSSFLLLLYVDPAATVESIQFIGEQQMQAFTNNVKMGPLKDALFFWQFYASQARIFADGPSSQGTKFLYVGLIPAYLKVLTTVPTEGGKSLLNNIYNVLHVCEDVDGIMTCTEVFSFSSYVTISKNLTLFFFFFFTSFCCFCWLLFLFFFFQSSCFHFQVQKGTNTELKELNIQELKELNITILLLF